MASGFSYQSGGTTTDLLDLSAKCDSLMVNGYGTTLKATNYLPDETNLVAYSTSILNGLWASRQASYCANYKVGTTVTTQTVQVKCVDGNPATTVLIFDLSAYNPVRVISATSGSIKHGDVTDVNYTFKLPRAVDGSSWSVASYFGIGFPSGVSSPTSTTFNIVIEVASSSGNLSIVPISIAAKGCAPVPKRYNNGSHMSKYTISGDYDIYYFAASDSNATSGAGIYTKSSGARIYNFLTSATHIVIDAVGGGGGGSGGNTGWNISGNSRGGAGGGAGGWASYLIDMTKAKQLSILIGRGGSGGGVESDGSAGGVTKITATPSSTSITVVSCNGGGGAVGSNYWDGCGAAGSGGSVTTTTSTNTTYGIKLLASGTGASGAKGASVSNTHGAGTQGGNGPSSVSFGGLLNFTNVSCTGGSAAKAASYDYSNLDDRCAIGGGGGGSLLAPGGHAGGAMKTYNTVYTAGQIGTNGSGGGGGHGGKSGGAGGKGGDGVVCVYYET